MAVILVILALLNSGDLEDGDGDHREVDKRDGDDGDDVCNGSAGNHRHPDIFLSHISLL